MIKQFFLNKIWNEAINYTDDITSYLMKYNYIIDIAGKTKHLMNGVCLMSNGGYEIPYFIGIIENKFTDKLTLMIDVDSFDSAKIAFKSNDGLFIPYIEGIENFINNNILKKDSLHYLILNNKVSSNSYNPLHIYLLQSEKGRVIRTGKHRIKRIFYKLLEFQLSLYSNNLLDDLDDEESEILIQKIIKFIQQFIYQHYSFLEIEKKKEIVEKEKNWIIGSYIYPILIKKFKYDPIIFEEFALKVFDSLNLNQEFKNDKMQNLEEEFVF